jgi:hypothetical protein
MMRLWLVRGRDQTRCRVELEAPGTGQKWLFVSFDDACKFLRHQIILQNESNGPDNNNNKEGG